MTVPSNFIVWFVWVSVHLVRVNISHLTLVQWKGSWRSVSYKAIIWYSTDIWHFIHVGKIVIWTIDNVYLILSYVIKLGISSVVIRTFLSVFTDWSQVTASWYRLRRHLKKRLLDLVIALWHLLSQNYAWKFELESGYKKQKWWYTLYTTVYTLYTVLSDGGL